MAKGEIYSGHEGRFFSLVTTHRTFDLEAASVAQRKVLVRAFNFLINRLSRPGGMGGAGDGARRMISDTGIHGGISGRGTTMAPGYRGDNVQGGGYSYPSSTGSASGSGYGAGRSDPFGGTGRGLPTYSNAQLQPGASRGGGGLPSYQAGYGARDYQD